MRSSAAATSSQLERVLRNVEEHGGISAAREERGRLLLARGALAGEPLYYRDAESARGRVEYSSSLRELAARGPLAIDAAGLRSYLAFGFVPAPRTLLAGISSVSPGTAVWFDRASGGRGRLELGARLDGADCSAREILAELGCRVKHAGSTALLLSGGLDSSSVALAASLEGVRLEAIHIRLARGRHATSSDTPCAREVAQRLGLAYREQKVGSLRALRLFGRAVRALDQPLGDPVVVPFYAAFALARRSGHRLVVTGEGGDQLFGSWATKPMLLWGAYEGDGSRRAAAYLESFHKLAAESNSLLAAQLREAAGEPPLEPVIEAWESSPILDPRERWRWVDLRLKGAQHILPRIGDMARAHGIALAHPLFAPGVVRSSFRWRPEQRVDGPRDKPLLKDAVSAWFPASVVERHKEGMGVPSTRWFRRALRPLANRWLHPRQLARSGLLDPEGVRALVRGDRASADARGRRRWGERLWQLCVLEAWFASLRD